MACPCKQNRPPKAPPRPLKDLLKPKPQEKEEKKDVKN